MEVSGVASRQAPCLLGAGAGIDNQRYSFPSNSSVSVSTIKSERKVRKLYARAMALPMDSGFKEKGYLQYYYGNCGATKERKKEIKKRLKDLYKLYHTPNFAQPQAKTIQEAAEILQKQLQQLKAEEKKLKKKRREEKAKMKAAQVTTSMLDCESSSSESSDSECGQVIDISRRPVPNELLPEPEPVIEAPTTATTSILPTQVDIMTKESVNYIEQESSCGGSTSISACSCSSPVMPTKRIEVCMGNKCKKSGSAALLEEFERVMGADGVVVGCKCMGKCRDGPNVKVVNSVDNDGLHDSLTLRSPSSNPLCFGVGLEDVSVIVANFCGGDNGKGLVLTPASS